MSRAIAKPITKSFALNITFDSVDGSDIDIDSVVAEFKQRLERLRSGGELSGAGFTVDEISLASEINEMTYQEQSMMLASLRIAQDKIETDGVDSIKQMAHFDDVEPLETKQIEQLCESFNSSTLFVAY